MAERWQEIMDEFYEGKHGRCEDPLDFEVRASKRIVELEAINRGVYEQMAKALPVPPLCSGDNTIEGVRQMRLTMESQRGKVRKLEAEVERLTRQNAAYLLQRDSSRELRDRAQDEVERLREALEVVRGEIDHMFHSVESFTPGWLARIRNAARKALGDA